MTPVEADAGQHVAEQVTPRDRAIDIADDQPGITKVMIDTRGIYQRQVLLPLLMQAPMGGQSLTALTSLHLDFFLQLSSLLSFIIGGRSALRSRLSHKLSVCYLTFQVR